MKRKKKKAKEQAIIDYDLMELVKNREDERVNIPASPDASTMSINHGTVDCKRCRIPVPAFMCEVYEWPGALGYKMFRIRMVSEKCPMCGERTVRRAGFYKVVKGEYVKD